MRLGSVRCGLSFSGRVSIIMLQKVSAGIVFCAEDWVYENKDEDIMKARSLEKSGLLAYAIFSEKKLSRAESSTESQASYGIDGSRIATSFSMVSSARFESFCLLKLRKERLFLSIKWLSVICHTVVPCGMVISSFCFSWRIRL